MDWINTPQTLKDIEKGKELGVNSFIVEFSPDRYPPMQEGLFYLKNWCSIDQLIVKWLCLEHDIVLLFSAKDNIKFADVEMERKFKNLIGGTATYNPNDKYSRLSMAGMKLFELPKDTIESCNVITRALQQQKLKIAVVIERAEVLLSNTPLDPRLIDSVKSWITDTGCHTLILLTDNKDNIYHDIRRMNPPLVMHFEWKPPTKEDFERLFTSLKIVKPYLFKESDPVKLASACEGIHYAELETLLNKLEEKKGALTETMIKNISGESRKQTVSNRVGSCFIAEKPDVTFNQVIGMDSIIERIRTNFIYPDKYPELFKNRRIKKRTSLLLYGPPGNGKTLLGKAIATELEAVFLSLTVTNIKDKYVGVSESRIREAFEEARRHSSSVLFFDEIDSIVPRREGNDNGHMNGAVAQFLSEMDGLVTHKQGLLLVIGATNRPQNIDNAALRPGRFDYKILVPLPNIEARKKMFYLYLNGGLIDDIDYVALAESTDGYSGADISHICEETESNLFGIDIKKGRSLLVTTDSLLNTINSTVPSVSREEAEWFRQFESRGVRF